MHGGAFGSRRLQLRVRAAQGPDDIWFCWRDSQPRSVQASRGPSWSDTALSASLNNSRASTCSTLPLPVFSRLLRRARSNSAACSTKFRLAKYRSSACQLIYQTYQALAPLAVRHSVAERPRYEVRRALLRSRRYAFQASDRSFREPGFDDAGREPAL